MVSVSARLNPNGAFWNWQAKELNKNNLNISDLSSKMEA